MAPFVWTLLNGLENVSMDVSVRVSGQSHRYRGAATFALGSNFVEAHCLPKGLASNSSRPIASIMSASAVHEKSSDPSCPKMATPSDWSPHLMDSKPWLPPRCTCSKPRHREHPRVWKVECAVMLSAACSSRSVVGLGQRHTCRHSLSASNGTAAKLYMKSSQTYHLEVR